MPVASRLGERLGTALLQEVARVEIVGQREDPQIGLLGDKQLQHFVGPLLPRFVAIQHQHDAIDEPLEDADVRLAQGHAQHGHGVR